MASVVAKQHEVFALVERSSLSEECKQLYKEHVRDTIRALSYSFDASGTAIVNVT